VAVVDDFAHHPTAIREPLQALRLKYPGRRLWAVFEPRSNTTRRGIFQRELAGALAAADVVLVAQVAALERLKPEERLDPARLIEEVRQTGRRAEYIPGVPEIVALAEQEAKPGDVIAVLSNGGFGDIHQRLLEALQRRGAAPQTRATRTAKKPKSAPEGTR